MFRKSDILDDPIGQIVIPKAGSSRRSKFP